MAGAGGKEVGRLSIRVVPDMDGFRGQVEREANAAAQAADPEVKVDADTSKARREIKTIEDEKYGAVVDLDADTAGAEAHIREATHDRRMMVHVDTERSALDRLRGNIRDMGREMDRSFGGGRRGGLLSNFKMPDVLPNIAGLGGIPSLLLIVGALSLLAPALSLVSQALIGLPALVAAVALPIGVFALGMGGLKKALENSGLIDIVTGKKGKQTSKAGEALKKVQQDISDVFEKGFTPIFKNFAAALPGLTRGLPFVAKGIVDLAKGMSDALFSPANVANFDRFTNSVSTMLTNLGPGLGSFTTGMTSLITNVGDHLPGLGTVMSGWADRFNTWVADISKPMKDNLGKDIPGSSELDQAVSNMKPILGSLVNDIGALVDAGTKLAASPEMTKNITDTIDGLTNLILNSLPALSSAFDKIAGIFRQLGLANGEPGLGNTASTVDPKTGAVTKVDPKMVNPAVPWLTMDGRPVVDTAPPKPLASLTDVYNDPHAVAKQDNAPTFGQYFAGGLGAISRLPDNMDAWGSKFKESLLNALKDAPKTLWNDIGAVGGWMRGLLGGAGPSGTANAAPEPFNPGRPVGPTAPVPVQVVGPFAGVGGSAGIQQPMPGVQGATQLPVQAPKIEAPKLPPGSEKIWDPLIQATQAAGAQIGAEVSSWEGKIKSALDSAASGANASGMAIGTQLAAGIRAGEGAAVDAAHHLADAVKGALPHSPAKTGPFSGAGWGEVKTSGGAIASQFADGLDGGFEGVRSSSERLAQAVHDSMTSNGGILPPGLSAAVKRESAAIGIELDKLKQQKDALDPKDKGGRQAIQDQMKQLQALRTELGLDSKESKYASQYGGGEGPFTSQNAGQMISQALASALNGITGFGKANLSQFEQDLGMSGNGLVEQLGDYGLNFLTGTLNSLASGFFGGGQQGAQTNIYTTDMDGAMQAKQRNDNRLAMQHTQRSN